LSTYPGKADGEWPGLSSFHIPILPSTSFFAGELMHGLADYEIHGLGR
jgi:hypothetical protein